MWRDKTFWKPVQMCLTLLLAIVVIVDISTTLLHGNPVDIFEVLLLLVCANTLYFEEVAW